VSVKTIIIPEILIFQLCLQLAALKKMYSLTMGLNVWKDTDDDESSKLDYAGALTGNNVGTQTEEEEYEESMNKQLAGLNIGEKIMASDQHGVKSGLKATIAFTMNRTGLINPMDVKEAENITGTSVEALHEVTQPSTEDKQKNKKTSKRNRNKKRNN